MSTMPSEPMDVTHELDVLCRWGIRAAWHLSLLWGALVSLLSWTGGAEAATAVIRGLVTFLAFGLVGWGVNAVMVQAGNQEDEAADEKADAPRPDAPASGAAEGEVQTRDGEPAVGGHRADFPAAAPDRADSSAQDGSDSADYLAEAAS